MNMQTTGNPPPVKKKNIMAIFNPGALISGYFDKLPSLFALIVPGLSFFLLFLQTGLDRLRAENISGWGFVFMLAKGIFLGTFGIALLAAISFVLSRIMGGKWGIEKVLRSVALSYASALIFMIFGIIFNLFFKWNTTVAFGLTGVLWALGPLNTVFRAITGNKIVPAIVITSVCGSLTILGWYLLAAR